MSMDVERQMRQLGQMAAQAALDGDTELACRILSETSVRLEGQPQEEQLGAIYTAGMKDTFRANRKQQRQTL